MLQVLRADHILSLFANTVCTALQWSVISYQLSWKLSGIVSLANVLTLEFAVSVELGLCA
jgi:hypothetical protein